MTTTETTGAIDQASTRAANPKPWRDRVIRIATMSRQLLEELRTRPLDAAGLNRLRAIDTKIIGELLTERKLIEDMLDRNRAVLIESVRGLSDVDARQRLAASLTTPVSLIKQAPGAERIWFQRFWAGLDEDECDGYSRRDEGTFAVADDESLSDVIAEFEQASERARVIASRFDLDDVEDNPLEGLVSMRWTFLAMIEEMARHAGHGDIPPRANRSAHRPRHDAAQPPTATRLKRSTAKVGDPRL
jgi:hypothetical protein